MRYLLMFLCLVVMLTCIIYAAGSIAAGSIHVYKWSEPVRLTMCTLWAIFTVGAGCVVINAANDDY